MARHVLKDVGIWIEGLDFAGVSNSVGIELSADTPEDTVFASGEWRSYAEGGLKTDTLTLEGLYDTTGPDADIFDSLGKEESAMVVPDGQFPGDVAHIVPIVVSGYTPLSGSVGDLAAISYAAQGDKMPFRAQVMDVRDGVNSVTVIPRQRLFTAAPMIGARVNIWLHAQRTSMAGTMQAELRSGAAQSGGASSTRAVVAITSTGLYVLSFTIPDPPITHQWWGLSLTPAAAGVYDIAAAVGIS